MEAKPGPARFHERDAGDIGRIPVTVGLPMQRVAVPIRRQVDAAPVMKAGPADG